MARLAAYYQEDFHYPAVGRKQKKSAYVYYEQPKQRTLNGNRIRSLGASEPQLTPYATNSPRAFENELYDNESFCDAAPYDDRRFEPRSKKRYSYAEPVAYIPRNMQRQAVQRPMRDLCDYSRMMYPDNYYVHQAEPVFYPNDARDPWMWSPAFASPAFLSPPSPLDSGLSSQSSPSLEAESYPLTRSQRHRACLCPRTEYLENTDRCLSRFDSGRSSPGGYSSSYPTPRPGSRAAQDTFSQHQPRPSSRAAQDSFSQHQPRPSSRAAVDTFSQHHPRPGSRAATNIFAQHPPRTNIRYGKLGILGEQESKLHVERRVARNGERNGKLAPCVVVVEREGSERASSPEKSPGSESPMSVTGSSGSSGDGSGGGTERRRAAEREIRELEEMVARCGLGESDLLDRAERRDLPTVHQRLARSSSDTLYETGRHALPTLNPHEPPRRAPPCRRSGLPDRVADDMALRKQRRTEPRPLAPRNVTTYMLCSSHFTPSVAVGRDILLLDNPDVELDDLSYRRHYLGRQSQIPDPQPPFGIPLRPPPPQKVHNDYLHAVPSHAPQPLCHPRGNPDVVRDDMAFRTLRKEDPQERIYCDIAQVYEKKR